MDGLRISPTAHYTSYVWFRNGLSHPALASSRGRFYYTAFWPMNRAWERFGSSAGLERTLVVRHRAIDEILTRAIEAGEISQVIEIAAGYSARGLRFAQKFPHLTYLECDLAPIAQAKRARLDAAGLRGPNHEVRAIDATAGVGPESLAEVAAALDPAKGTAVITEGLLGYLDPATVAGIWRRIATALARFPRGLYLSDLFVASELRRSRTARAFRALLQAFVRGRTYVQAEDEAAAHKALGSAGFQSVDVRVPDSRALVRVIEARTAGR
jgi:O-methyltransferase involved in polyketide biosynthesis